MSIVIKAENLSKIYRLGIVSSRSIAQDANRLWAKVRGREDPYLKVGEVNRRDIKSNGKYIWALKDINFEVKDGEITGIIGRNGAGKSTLLKILSRVTTPTTGSIKIKGRVSSLLEVGTGFHQELTGRENIYLNGSILGMSRKEITRKFDEIVEFSGVERYIDTPVKRYSSGMHVRLAFAVAAYLEPKILIVDEVLAVGDAEFQKKCLGKMHDVSEKEGKTVLFVSHNMAAIKNLCTRGLLLENGMISYEGDIENTIGKYLSVNSETASYDLKERKDRTGNNKFKFVKVNFKDDKGKCLSQIISGDPLLMELHYECTEQLKGNLILYIGFMDVYGNTKAIFVTDEMGTRFENPEMKGTIYLKIPRLLLRSDKYSVRLFAGLNTTQTENILDSIENAMRIEVLQGDFWKTGKINRVGSFGIMDGQFYN
ncbi:MAG: ABC transporter ATP-binding protein [Ignavibacteria bacterium]